MMNNDKRPTGGHELAPVETCEGMTFWLPPSLELAVTANLKRRGRPGGGEPDMIEALMMMSQVRITVLGEHVGYIVMAQDGTLSLQDVKFGIIYQISPVTLWHALVRALNTPSPAVPGEEKDAGIVTLPVDTEDSGA